MSMAGRQATSHPGKAPTRAPILETGANRKLKGPGTSSVTEGRYIFKFRDSN